MHFGGRSPMNLSLNVGLQFKPQDFSFLTQTRLSIPERIEPITVPYFVFGGGGCLMKQTLM